jgi:hypothetical protein
MNIENVTDKMKTLLKKMSKQLQKHAETILGVCILVIVTLMIFRNFLFLNQWPTGGDALGWVARSYLYKDNVRWRYMWRPHSFGFVEVINGLDFFLSTTFQVLQSSPKMVEVFLFLSFLLAALSAYAFAFRYTHRHLSAFSASLVYVLNQWFTSQLFEVHLGIIFSYALAPLTFLFLDRALEKTKLKDIFAAALVLSIMITSFHAECIVIYGIFLILFIIFYALIPGKSDPFSARFKRIIKVCLPLSIIVFLISSFATLPFLVNARPRYFSSDYAYRLEEARMYGFKDPIKAFTLGATESWGYLKIFDVQTDLSFPGYPMLITTFMLLLCYSAVVVRRSRYTVFFVFSTILATCIAMGPNPPFDRFFTWMWYNIPYFSVFRAISRWIMIAALSHAFFVSQFTDILAKYVKRRRIHRWNRIFFRVETKRGSAEQGRWKTSLISINFINRISRKFHDLLFNLGMLALVLIIVTPFLSNFFVISTGLRTYEPIQSYLDPYIWMSDQVGDFKIVTVGQHPSDFADAAMSTDSGWGHEIGSESSFIHDKPVLQDGGWDFLPHYFVSYLRNRMVPYRMSDNLMSLLSAFNYRFVVLPSYSSLSNHEFFLNQKDTHIVYDASSKILESNYVNQRLFGVPEYNIVVGNIESLMSLYKIDSFSLNHTALFFADQLDAPFYENVLLRNSKAMICVDSSFTDMLMLSLRDKGCIITAENYGAIDLDKRVQWIQSAYWKNFGKFMFGEKTIVTSGKKSVDIPFELESSGNFTIWIRVIFAPKRGKLVISVDNTPVKQFKPLSYGPSIFSWVSIGNIQMQAGNHLITLSNDGSGENDIDAVAIVELPILESQKQSLENTLANFSGSIVHVSEAENAFSYNASSGWRYEEAPYNGFVLKSDEKGSNAALEGIANASSIYEGDVASFGAATAIDGSNTTRWASDPNMPQWLEISWSVPIELSGAEILFEDAKAQDYILQIWNGTDFIDLPETRIEENNETLRYHQLLHPVKTNKLRLFVTRASYPLVSVCEFRAYTRGRPVSTDVYIPRTGNFTLGFRLFSNLDCGTFYFQVSDHTEVIWCNTTKNDYKWFYSSESIYLERGNQTITVGGVGKIALDTMLLCPTLNGQVSNIFSGHSRPTVRYVQINPSEYAVDIETNSSFILVFSDAYHPLWRIYVDNSEVKPIITDYFVNGFFINKTGEFRARLFFVGQSYTDFGLKLSAVTILIIIVILAVPSGSLEKMKTHLKSLRRRMK